MLRLMAEQMLNIPVTAKMQIYEWLKGEIIANRLHPGTVIDKNELKDQLNVSLTPLREALILLSHDGLLELNPSLNTKVTLIDIDIVRESVFIRAALEGSIAEKLAEEGLTLEQLNGLKEILEKHAKALEMKAISEVYKLDFAFHQMLSELSGFQSLWKHVEQYRVHIDRVLNCSPDNLQLIRSSFNDHKKIIEAIEQRSAAIARNRMRKHVSRIMQDIDSLPTQYVLQKE